MNIRMLSVTPIGSDESNTFLSKKSMLHAYYSRFMAVATCLSLINWNH